LGLTADRRAVEGVGLYGAGTPHAVRHHDDHTAIVLLRTGLDDGGLALAPHPRPRPHLLTGARPPGGPHRRLPTAPRPTRYHRPRLHILIGDRPPGVHHRRITTGAGTTGHQHHTAEQQTNLLETHSLIPHVHCSRPRMTSITRPAPSRTGAVSINGWHPGPG